MIDSLAHAVRIVNDSLQVVVGGPPIQVPPAQVVLAPDRGLWASPMFQTLLGGVLAVIGGVRTELFRKWRTDHSKRVKLTKAIETPLRALCALLRDWSRRHHRPEGVRLAYAQECMRLWTYGERTRSLWAELEDNALEREVEDWYAETLDAIKLSITYLADPEAPQRGARGTATSWPHECAARQRHAQGCATGWWSAPRRIPDPAEFDGGRLLVNDQPRARWGFSPPVRWSMLFSVHARRRRGWWRRRGVVLAGAGRGGARG